MLGFEDPGHARTLIKVYDAAKKAGRFKDTASMLGGAAGVDEWTLKQLNEGMKAAEGPMQRIDKAMQSIKASAMKIAHVGVIPRLDETVTSLATLLELYSRGNAAEMFIDDLLTGMGLRDPKSDPKYVPEAYTERKGLTGVRAGGWEKFGGPTSAEEAATEAAEKQQLRMSAIQGNRVRIPARMAARAFKGPGKTLMGKSLMEFVKLYVRASAVNPDMGSVLQGNAPVDLKLPPSIVPPQSKSTDPLLIKTVDEGFERVIEKNREDRRLNRGRQSFMAPGAVDNSPILKALGMSGGM